MNNADIELSMLRLVADSGTNTMCTFKKEYRVLCLTKENSAVMRSGDKIDDKSTK